MAKKYCSYSSFFSCLACFSGNTHPPVDSRESATNLMDASAHAIIPNACPDAQSFSPAIAAANSTVSPAAATEEADGRRHDPHTVPSASAPPFQASTSHDASSSADCASANSIVSPAAATEEADGRRHDPHTVPSASASASAPPFQAFTSHDASSSADCASTSAVPTQDAPASGGPSSSFPTESDFIKKIREAAEVDKIDGNANLEGLIQHISERLEFMKKNELDKKRSSDHHLPKSSVFVKSKEVLSEAIEASSSLKDVTSFVRLEQAHWAPAGLLVVSNVLERFEAVSANRDECLGLLDEMYILAKYVNKLKKLPRSMEEMEDLIQNAREMIVKAAIMCCAQIPSSKLSRFFPASVDKGELLKFQAELQNMSYCMKTGLDICLYEAIPTPLEREYPDYAVGIEESLKEVEKLLEWESEKKAVAVIVYGFGGVGKSTLADAVFARHYFECCKYSKVRLFDDITSTPNIVEKQKCILRDLTMEIGKEKDPRTFESGQLEISRVLEKQVAFIYVDNVLDSDRLEELFPRDMHRAKRVRVLITARNNSVRTVCGMETKFYAMNGLPKATSLSKKEMNEGGLASSQSGFYGYDVFINHRGPDTKKTFSSYLYHRLVLHGLKPFLDKQELQEGLNFPTQIEGAIRSASVHVAIFSPTYAKSQWCLEELLFMRETRAPIIPVFYHVQPADLRWTDQNKDGVYARALHELQLKKTYDHQIHQEKSRYDPITIQNWRDALSSVAEISGFDLDGAFNGDRGLMLEKVVERVLKVIKKPGTYAPNIPQNLAHTSHRSV